MEPVRAAPAFAATLKATEPLPLPDAPPVIETHGTFAVAVHAQPAPAVKVTATLPLPPAAPKDPLEGAIEKLQAAAACDTVAVAVPIVSVAVRVPPLLAATLKVAVPPPVPEPLTNVIQEASLCAFHPHDGTFVATATEAAPPDAVTVCVGGVTVYVHSGGGGGGGMTLTPSCRTTIVSPATSTDPSRVSPVFAATPSVTDPSPLPFAPDTTAIHPTLLCALQAHAATLAVTDTCTAPPLAGSAVGDADTVNRQGAGSCVSSIAAPFTDSVPRLEVGSELGATRNDTVPSPWPVAPDVIEIHGAAVVATHVQSRLVVTVAVPVAPANGAVCSKLETET